MSQAAAYHACMITPNDTYIHGFSHMSSQELLMHSRVSLNYCAYNYTVTHAVKLRALLMCFQVS